MFVIRPIQEKDFAELYKIADESGHGFTSLPVNEELIRNKIARAEASFLNSDPEKPGDFGYLFVMEDTKTGAIMGTSGIESAVGLDDAFYHYHLSQVVHNSRELNIYNTAEVLTLCNDYTGASELCTLFLREPYRSGIKGRVLSKFRFLFLAQHKQRFSETVIAEMRGVSDENGNSPFWQWLEENFFSMDFPTADYLTGIGQKVFIAELMPKYPVYVNLLSQEAQAVIGKVHPKTKPALKLLQSEGFAWKGYVDIFDAGPTVEANLSQIRTATDSALYTVTLTTELTGSDNIILANTKLAGFRATAAKAAINQSDNTIALTQEIIDVLDISEGEEIRAVKLI